MSGVVSFYFPEREVLRGIDPATLDPERDWAVFGTGVYVWILQTFVRLHHAGAPVRLVDVPPAAGLVVVHADHVERVLFEAASPASLTVVAARSDRGQQFLADFEVVQNVASVDRYQFFIPSWLQPGLISRAPDRGMRVEEIAYIGALKELDPELASPEWGEVLRARGLRWDSRTITYVRNDRVYPQLRWNDYSTTDVVVAFRSPRSWNVRSKPAAKLQNAWAAGVPAILSPEAPYQELRRTPLDYLEARSIADILDAIEMLRSDPGLYAAMVQNGLERAREFQPACLVERWRGVLWQEIPARAGRRGHRLLAKARGWRARARTVRNRWKSKALVPGARGHAAHLILDHR